MEMSGPVFYNLAKTTTTNKRLFIVISFQQECGLNGGASYFVYMFGQQDAYC